MTLLASARAERVDNGIAIVMDVLSLCGLTIASLIAMKKDVS